MRCPRDESIALLYFVNAHTSSLWVQSGNLKIVAARGGSSSGADAIFDIDTSGTFSYTSNYFDYYDNGNALLQFNTRAVSVGDVNNDGHEDIIRCIGGNAGCKACIILSSRSAYVLTQDFENNTTQLTTTHLRDPRVLSC